MEIEYDARKNDDNLAKHGVTLDEAAEVWNGVVVNILQLGRLLRKRGVSTMTKRITSEEFDTRFDAGEDLDDYLDYDAVTVEDATPRDVLLSFCLLLFSSFLFALLK